MRVLYFDCFAGISGDMTLGALLDLGIDQDKFLAELNKLNVEGFSIKISKTRKNGIEGTKVDVIISEHHHDEHHSHHHHRRLADIERIIDESGLEQKVKELSKSIFMKVAQAEAKIHGMDLQEVHFHEVGALDSIVDIVGAAICINMLNADKIISSPLHDGAGFVPCQHGLIPIPAPATLEILRESSVPFYSTGIQSELVTPTGAAIITTIADEFGSMPMMKAVQVGYGAGTRDLEIPNLLRVMVGEIKKNDKILVMECNIDDMSGEIGGYVMEKLFEAGALDVFYTPIYMKKNRPAVLLSVLCHKEEAELLQNILLKETTTIGIRQYEVDRVCMDRVIKKVDTPYGNIRVKVSSFNNIVKYSPEYEDCRSAAIKHKVPLKAVYQVTMNVMSALQD
mgnify:FL=1